MEIDENSEKNNKGGGLVYLIGFVVVVLGLALAFNAYSFFSRPSTTSVNQPVASSAVSSGSYSQSMAAMHGGVPQQVGSCGA